MTNGRTESGRTTASDVLDEDRPYRSISASLEVNPEPAEVGRCRRWTAGVLAGWDLAGTAEAATVLVSELVTNAINATMAGGCAGRRSGPHGVAVHLNVDDDTLRISVCDVCLSTWPEPRRPVARDEGGRGLQVVAALCEQWGCFETDRVKVVWCELPAIR